MKRAWIALVLLPGLLLAETLQPPFEEQSWETNENMREAYFAIDSHRHDNQTITPEMVVTDTPMMFRNRIINGDMVIDQRNAGAAVTVNSTADAYPVDRFHGSGQTADGVFTLDQDTEAPDGFRYSVKATVTTADASIGAAQVYVVRQIIEGYNIADAGFGTSWAKQLTLSFWVRSSETGTFGGAFSNSAANRSYPYTYTINTADTWERKTVTFTADTSGTWLTTNGRGLSIYWDMGTGSSGKGTAGTWGGAAYFGATGATDLIATLNATWYITGVQLELGPVATAFEHRPFSAELSLCERYYEKSYQYGTVPGTAANLGQELYRRVAAGETQTLFAGVFKTRKRATPTITWYSTLTGTSGRIFNAASGDVVVTGTTGVNERATGSADHGADGLAANIIIAQWVADAEL